MNKGTGTGKLLITAGIVILLAVFVSEQGFATNLFSWNTKPIHLEKSVKADNIRSVLVDSGSTDVNVIRGNSGEIEVRLDGDAKREVADSIQLQVEPQSDTLRLKVEIPDGFQLGFNFSDLVLTVELPNHSWEAVKVHSDSGDVDVEELKGKNVEIYATSGDVTVNDIESNRITLQAGSGNIVTKDFIAESLTFDTESGDVNLSGGQSSIKGEAGSGNIEVTANDLIHDMDLKANSGDVTVLLANEPKSLTVQYNGGSGSGKIDWEGVTYKERSEDDHKLKGVFGTGETNLKVRTGSGNFTLGQD